MATLNKHDKAVQAAMKAMTAGGAKFPKWGKALKFLSPLLTASMLFEGLRKIPGIGDIMEKIDDLDAWVTKNTLGRIPVLKWNNALKKAGQNFLSGGNKGIKDYIHEDDDNSGDVKEEDNDRSWYEPGYDVSIPTNEGRPIDLNMVPLFTQDKSFLGGIAKLSKLCVSGYSIYKSKSIRNTVQTIYKAMRDNLKSNIVYSVNEVMCVLLNNISIYIMQKHLERRLGFTKFEDPEFKNFYDLWKKKSLSTVNYGIYDLEDNPNLDVTTAEFGISLTIYEKLVSMSDRCVLPSHFKDWIDHYFGSVMILDDDVANKKYIMVQADSVPFYSIDNQGNVVENLITLDDSILTPEYMYQFIDEYFHESKVAVILSDYAKAAKLGKLWSLSGFTTGWLTSMSDYKPVPIIDRGFKQALINAYTYDGAHDDYIPNYYRLDRIDGVSDDLTTYLFLGKLFNNRRTTRIYGTKTWEANRLEVLVYADKDTPVYVPKTMIQTAAFINAPRVVEKLEPFAFVVQSNISSDIYVGANVSIANVTTRYYGPTNSYPVLCPATTECTCNISADRNFNLEVALPNYLGLLLNTQYLFLPLVMALNESNQPIIFFKRKAFDPASLLDNDIVFNGSGDLGGLLYTVPGEPAYEFMVKNQLLPCITANDYLGHDAVQTYGGLGTITLKHQSGLLKNSVTMNFDMYSLVFSRIADEPTQMHWVQYSLYPNSDISTQYCLVTENETRTSAPSFNYGYAQMAATIFTMLGYSIPMFTNLRVHVSILSEEYVDSNYNQILLKEDYVPFYINADDFPYILDTMFDGLFNYRITTDVDTKTKES